MNNQNKDFQQKLKEQINNQNEVEATDYSNAAQLNNAVAQLKKKSKKSNKNAQFNNSNSNNQMN